MSEVYSLNNVPGFFDYADIYDEVVRTAPAGSTLVEVGTLYGKSALYMAQKIKESNKDLKFYCVDFWQDFGDPIFARGADTVYARKIEEHGSIFQAFAHYVEISGLSNIIRVLRMDSAEAAQHFKDPFFVFIDADHSYEGCMRDIKAWRSVMSPGSILAGHDYDWEGVRRSVDEFLTPVEVWHRSWFKRL